MPPRPPRRLVARRFRSSSRQIAAASARASSGRARRRDVRPARNSRSCLVSIRGSSRVSMWASRSSRRSRSRRRSGVDERRRRGGGPRIGVVLAFEERARAGVVAVVSTIVAGNVAWGLGGAPRPSRRRREGGVGLVGRRARGVARVKTIPGRGAKISRRGAREAGRGAHLDPTRADARERSARRPCAARTARRSRRAARPFWTVLPARAPGRAFQLDSGMSTSSDHGSVTRSRGDDDRAVRWNISTWMAARVCARFFSTLVGEGRRTRTRGDTARRVRQAPCENTRGVDELTAGSSARESSRPRARACV